MLSKQLVLVLLPLQLWQRLLQHDPPCGSSPLSSLQGCHMGLLLLHGCSSCICQLLRFCQPAEQPCSECHQSEQHSKRGSMETQALH